MSKKLSFRLSFVAILGATFLGAFSNPALALTCTSGSVNVNSAGYNLGCASPTLWAVLSYNESTSGTTRAATTLTVIDNAGTSLSTPGVQVGVYGGKIVTNSATNAVDFAGNIVKTTTGASPSGPTDTSGVVITSPALSTIFVNDNALMLAARTDALSAVSAMGSYVASVSTTSTSTTDGYQRIGSSITGALTINAEKDGLNVIDLTAGSGINLSGTSDVLTFNKNGKSNVQFLVNVTGNFSVASGAQIVETGGLLPMDVLFDISSAGATINMTGTGTQVSGTLLSGSGSTLSTTGSATLDDGAKLFGSLIAGSNVTLASPHPAQIQDVTIQDCTAAPTPTNPQMLSCVVYTPEPATLALLLVGLLGLPTVRRRLGYFFRPRAELIA